MAAVCVFCSSSAAIDAEYLRLAAEVGTRLARHGHTVVSGGGSVSCMGELARAARAAGGHTVGVIPRFLLDLEVADHDADELVVTEDMRSRKAEMDRRSDAFLVLPGGLGTLEEFFEMWVGRVLGVHAKPTVMVDADGFWDPLRGQLDRIAERGFARREVVDELIWTTRAADAVDAVERALGSSSAADSATVVG